MAHNLETHVNGATAFAENTSDRLSAWHRLGQKLDHAMTAEETLTQAYLANWDVRKTPLQTTATVEVNGEKVPFKLDVERDFASVRTNPVTGLPEVLGVVGKSYVPIQNEASTELLNAIVDESGSHFETAGSLNGGRQTFVTMRIPAALNFGGRDPYDLYLAALNSHDGSSAFRFIVTPVRIVCANTQAAALKAAKASFGVRHTRNAKNVIAQAREALGLTFKYAEEFEVEMAKLMDAELTTKELGDMVDAIWTPPKDDESRTIITRHNERKDTVLDLFANSPTLVDFRGTRYGAFNAFTEYLDHFTPVPSTAKDPEAVRALRTLTSEPVRHAKEKAFDLLKIS